MKQIVKQITVFVFEKFGEGEYEKKECSEINDYNLIQIIQKIIHLNKILNMIKPTTTLNRTRQSFVHLKGKDNLCFNWNT